VRQSIPAILRSIVHMMAPASTADSLYAEFRAKCDNRTTAFPWLAKIVNFARAAGELLWRALHGEVGLADNAAKGLTRLFSSAEWSSLPEVDKNGVIAGLLADMVVACVTAVTATGAPTPVVLAPLLMTARWVTQALKVYTLSEIARNAADQLMKTLTPACITVLLRLTSTAGTSATALLMPLLDVLSDLASITDMAARIAEADWSELPAFVALPGPPNVRVVGQPPQDAPQYDREQHTLTNKLATAVTLHWPNNQVDMIPPAITGGADGKLRIPTLPRELATVLFTAGVPEGPGLTALLRAIQAAPRGSGRRDALQPLQEAAGKMAGHTERLAHSLRAVAGAGLDVDEVVSFMSQLSDSGAGVDTLAILASGIASAIARTPADAADSLTWLNQHLEVLENGIAVMQAKSVALVVASAAASALSASTAGAAALRQRVAATGLNMLCCADTPVLWVPVLTALLQPTVQHGEILACGLPNMAREVAVLKASADREQASADQEDKSAEALKEPRKTAGPCKAAIRAVLKASADREEARKAWISATHIAIEPHLEALESLLRDVSDVAVSDCAVRLLRALLSSSTAVEKAASHKKACTGLTNAVLSLWHERGGDDVACVCADMMRLAHAGQQHDDMVRLASAVYMLPSGGRALAAAIEPSTIIDNMRALASVGLESVLEKDALNQHCAAWQLSAAIPLLLPGVVAEGDDAQEDGNGLDEGRKEAHHQRVELGEAAPVGRLVVGGDDVVADVGDAGVAGRAAQGLHLVDGLVEELVDGLAGDGDVDVDQAQPHAAHDEQAHLQQEDGKHCEAMGPTAVTQAKLEYGFLAAAPSPLLAAAVCTTLQRASLDPTSIAATPPARIEAIGKLLTDPACRATVVAVLRAQPAAIMRLQTTALPPGAKRAAHALACAALSLPNSDSDGSGESGDGAPFGGVTVDGGTSTVGLRTIADHFLQAKAALQRIINDPDTGDSSSRAELGVASNTVEGRKPGLVLTPTTSANVHLVCDAATTGVPLLLEGATGVGKSATVEEAAHLSGAELLRFNLSSHTGIDDLIARVSIGRDEAGDAKVDLHLQPFADAFIHGRWLLLDELNLAPDGVLRCIEEALDTGLIHVSHPSDPDFKPLSRHANFRLFATQNPGSGFFKGKREMLSTPLLNRFSPVVFRELPREEWATIIEHKLQADFPMTAVSMTETLLAWHFQYRDMIDNAENPFPERAAYTETSLREVLRVVSGCVHARRIAGTTWDSARWRPVMAQEVWLVYGARLRKLPARLLVKELMDAIRLVPAVQLHDAAAARSFSLTFDADYVKVGPTSLTRVVDTDGPVAAPTLTVDMSLEVTPAVENYIDVLKRYARRVAEDCGARGKAMPFALPDTTCAGMARAHVAVLQRIYASDFIERHGVCDVSDVQLLKWATQLILLPDRSDVWETAALLATPLYCDQLRHASAQRDICVGLATELRKAVGLTAPLPEPTIAELIKASDGVNLITGAATMPATKRPALAVTGRVKALWASMARSVETRQPFMVVGPVGCGKSEALGAAARLTNRRLLPVCMTPETEPSELVGQFTPAAGAGHHIEWTDGPLTTAYRAGGTVLLDNVQDADACVLERLNSVLESRPSLLLAEKGDVKPVDGPHTNFRVLATMSTGTGGTDVSPALANRFTLLHMSDLPPSAADASPELEAIATVLTEEGGPVPALTDVCAAVWTFSQESQRLKDAGVTLRTLVRMMDCSYQLRRLDPTMTAVDSVLHAFRIAVEGQLAARAGEDVASLRQVVRTKLGVTEDPRPLDFTRWTQGAAGPGGVAGRSQHVLRGERLRSAEDVAACVACGYPVLLEGPPAVGKTTLVEALGRNVLGEGARLRRINNSDTTTVQDYLGSVLPLGDGFVFQPGELVRAMELGHWFLSDEFNLADPAVMSMLAPLLEGKRVLQVPGRPAVVAHASFRFFATQNPAKDAGRYRLPAALRSRFLEVAINDFTETDLAEVIKLRVDDAPPGIPAGDPPDEAAAQKLAAAYFRLPEAFPGIRMTMREVVKWTRRSRIFRTQTLRAAGELLIMPRVPAASPDAASIARGFTNAGFIEAATASLLGARVVASANGAGTEFHLAGQPICELPGPGLTKVSGVA
jgi:MoxR-like ATPase